MATVNVRRRKWGQNTQIEGAPDFTMTLNNNDTLPEVQIIAEPDLDNPGSYITFHRQMWTYYKVGQTYPEISDSMPLSVVNPKDGSDATCWYSWGGGPDDPHVTVWGFSLVSNQFVPCPVTNIQGGSAGTSGCRAYTTSDDAVITVATDRNSGKEVFAGWHFFFHSGYTVANNELSVTQGTSGWALALYKKPTKIPPELGPMDEPEPEERDPRPYRPDVDPSPLDMVRLQEVIRFLRGGDPQDPPMARDRLGEVIRDLHTMGEGELRTAQAELRAERARLDTAEGMVEVAMKEVGKGR